MHTLQTPLEAAQWLRAQVSAGTLHTDSRKVHAGDGFIAWPGAATDGRRYVDSCLKAGANAILVERDGAESYGFSDARVAAYPGLKADSGLIASHYYAHPSQRLDVLAVTGTNGKTSTAWWLAQAMAAHGKPCGLVGTLGVGTPGQMQFTGLTTPDPVLLQAQFAHMRHQEFTACAIEASSIGIAEARLAGTRIKVAIFTNFTQDHLDYHGSMDSYWLAKRALFDWSSLQAAVINLDDTKAAELISHCKARDLNVITVSMQDSHADLYASEVRYAGKHMRFEVAQQQNKYTVSCPVVGEFNIANLLGVMGAIRALGVSLEDICQALAHCTPVPGRMETLGGDDAPLVVVDYAHTPDALAKALTACRAVSQSRSGKLWSVFGCGGNRDASKRPLMARAAQGADSIVLTSDNPRHESPADIAAQVQRGFDADRAVHTELDRATAIRYAITNAQPQDVILLAGKGHEDYQETAGVKHPFSDLEQAKLALLSRPQYGEVV